jgi:surfactin family lipopeptide synthetase C
VNDVEDIYGLSPLQAGLLFHSLYQPDAGLYVEQIVSSIAGDVDLPTFAAAWRAVVIERPVLRTSFHWEGLDDPLQVVRRDAPIVVSQQDWRAASTDRQHVRLRSFLADDRRIGFTLDRAPLMRISVIRMTDTSSSVVLSFHHLLLDGWSLHHVLDDVQAAYRALVGGAPVKLPARRPYADYIAWLQAQDADAAEAFWRTALADVDGPTRLRLPVPGPAETDARSYDLEVDAASTAALRAAARSARVTLNTVVHAAWALVLARWTGSDDVIAGGVVSGRPPSLTGVEAMVGLFINTLPIRVRLNGDATVAATLRRLHEDLAAMREFEYSPLVDIQRWSGSPAGVPLFDTLVVFENYPMQHRPTSDATDGGARAFERTNYPLCLVVGPGERLMVQMSFDPSVLDAETVQRIGGHFRNALRGIAGGIDRRVREIDITDAAERRTVVQRLNATEAPYPRDTTLHELFDRVAVQRPDAVALIDDGKPIVYRELAGRADALAHALRAASVGPHDPVGVSVARSAGLVAGLLGVLKAGAAFVPLDPAMPLARLSYLADSAGCRVIVADATGRTALSGIAARIVDPGAGAKRAALPGLVAGDDIAYLMYTSGSTGEPKGVMGTHRGAVNRCAWMWRTFPFAPGEVACLKTNLAFVDSVWETFGALLAGVPSVIIRDAVMHDHDRLIETLRAGRVTRIVLVPSLLRALLDGRRQLGAMLPDLRTWISSGDRLTPDLARDFRAAVPGGRLLNLYGSTEVAADVTFWELPPVVPDVIPIGRPISNTRIYVVDRWGMPAPVGAPGEILVGGDGLANGYWGRPELTAERFIDGAERVYRTGDLARWLPDGNLEFLGRRDQQLKIRGVRVEPAEAEAALLGHPSVRDAAVVMDGATDGEPRLVAYLAGDRVPAAHELRTWLRQRLPEALVPAAFMVVPSVPRTPSGKLDARALPVVQVEPGVERPRTPLEERIAGIWAEALGVDRVGVDDDFFSDLGGHSLLATRVTSRLRQAFGVDLPIAALFEASTVSALAVVIEQMIIDELEEGAPRSAELATGRIG